MKKIKLSDKTKEAKVEGVSSDNLSGIESIKIDEDFMRENCNVFTRIKLQKYLKR